MISQFNCLTIVVLYILPTLVQQVHSTLINTHGSHVQSAEAARDNLVTLAAAPDERQLQLQLQQRLLFPPVAHLDYDVDLCACFLTDGNDDNIEQPAGAVVNEALVDLSSFQADRNSLLRLLNRHQAGEFGRLLNRTGALDELVKLSKDARTIFAPLDHAFERVPERIKQYFIKHPDRLKKLLLFHVLKQRKSIDELSNGGDQTLKTLFNDWTMRLVYYDQHNSLVAGSGLVLKDKSDISSDFGVVHLLHDVILSVPRNTSEGVISVCPNFSTMRRALSTAGLDSVLNQPGPFTVLLPSEAAWAQLPSKTIDYLFRNRTALKLVVMYHIVKGTWFKEGLETGQQLMTISGRTLLIHRSPDTGILRINKIGVEYADVGATNGVMHVMKGVLIPPEIVAQMHARRRLPSSWPWSSSSLRDDGGSEDEHNNVVDVIEER